ncbi:MAG TPA: hypothetical protein VFB25_05555 [Gaiellaceae bacterium]|nr:hypothetical protein [Gaiellaceae bacterium]
MPLVHECAHEGCHILTMSLYCLEHEQPAGRRVDETLLAAASAAADISREADEPS